jgi:two-component system, OmpR family, response regulator MtrA
MVTSILLIEDDDRIRSALRLALEDEGYTVHEAASGETGLAAFAERPAGVVLIDVLLPGIDGFDVCRRLRQDSDVPIVMVTARDESQDVIAGLEAGADDYLAKPVNAKVLAARIRALLRRARASAGPGARRARLAFGQVEVLPEDGVVRVAGDEVHLTKTEFRLLVELASTPGRVFSREQLLETVWGYDYFGDGRIVDVHVRRLRVKIEPDPAAPRHVLTVRGRGYKLAGS